MSLRSETGSILVLVLIIVAAISLLSVHLMGQGLLTTKLSTRFQAHLYASVEAENRLLEEELKVKKDPNAHLENKIAFVPDHLAFGCKEGVEIFKAKASPLVSFTAIRSPDENTTLLIPSCQRIIPKGEWDEEAKWLELVKLEAPHTKCFEPLRGYPEFTLKNGLHTSRIFGLWDGGATKKGELYLMDNKTQVELAHFELPFPISNGTLTVSDAYYSNDWHTILVLTAKDKLSEKALILIFDITDPTKRLDPFIQDPCSELLIEKGRPAVIRLSDGRFGVAVIGNRYQQGILQIFLLDQAKSILRFSVGSKNLTFLTAIDLNQQGFVDRFYVADESQLWALNFTNIQQVTIEKLADAEVLASPLIIKEVAGEGVRIYFLGRTLKTQGLFMVQDPLKSGGSLSLASLIATGDFGAFFIRFGRLWLVPRDLYISPSVIDLPSHQRVATEWKFLDSNLTNKELLSAKLMWDAEHETEVVLILNPTCQLNILGARFQNSKYGRVLWRKEG